MQVEDEADTDLPQTQLHHLLDPSFLTISTDFHTAQNIIRDATWYRFVFLFILGVK